MSRSVACARLSRPVKLHPTTGRLVRVEEVSDAPFRSGSVGFGSAPGSDSHVQCCACRHDQQRRIAVPVCAIFPSARPVGRVSAAYRDCRHVRPMQTERRHFVHCKENLSLWSPWWSLWWLFVVIVVVLRSPWSSRRNGRRRNCSSIDRRRSSVVGVVVVVGAAAGAAAGSSSRSSSRRGGGGRQ